MYVLDGNPGLIKELYHDKYHCFKYVENGILLEYNSVSDKLIEGGS